MEIDIPIIVTRKGRISSDIHFKYASPQLLQSLNQNRNPSIPRPRKNNIEPRHQTLDANNKNSSRTRRISSSAAAKRFPKDFFKDQNCLHPIKSIKGKHKQNDPNLLETFNQNNFLLCEKQKQQEHKSGGDTPKFKQKDSQDISGEFKKGHKIGGRMQQLFQETPANRYKTASEAQSKHKLQFAQDRIKQDPQPFGVIPFISNFNVTLGQKAALAFLLKTQKGKKKNIAQKQNQGTAYFQSTKRQANLRAQGFRIRRKVPN